MSDAKWHLDAQGERLSHAVLFKPTYAAGTSSLN
jgi:hypothetical protein